MSRLPPEPALDWSDDGVPRALAFDDTYYSRDGGLAESEAVFLRGCDLPEAWNGRARFAICELGFGTGLNALAVWRAWKARKEPNAILHMYSVESFPFGESEAARAHAKFPAVEPLSAQLLARWPVRAYGPQRFWFPDDGFALTLMIGEAGAALDALDGCFDAWFLDGFAPARNAAMWTPAIFQRIAALSVPGARLASFTVAGEVRRNLEAVGFRVEKKPGFGAKRERLEAVLAANVSTPHALYPNAPCHPKRVAILGAGIAGAATAAALARRNVETILLDASPVAGAGASGNPWGLVAPRLDRDSSPIAEMFLAAYLDAIATYRALGEGVFTSCGLEERPGARDAAVIAALLDDPPLPPDWLTRLGESAAFYPQAGVVSPQAAIAAFTRNAQVMYEAEIAALERAGDGWRLIAPDGRVRLKADAVVLACGAGLSAFEPASFLPLQFSRGQIEWGPVRDPPAHALLGPCFAAPCADGLMFGATFDRVEPDAAANPDMASRQRNLEALERMAPDLAARLNRDALASRAALRVSTPDRAPIVGLMPDAPTWLAQNAGIAHGRPPPDLPAPALAGVYILGALGARGFMLAPLMGEAIAASMFGEPAPLSAKSQAATHPARFLHRALRKSVTIRDPDDGV